MTLDRLLAGPEPEPFWLETWGQIATALHVTERTAQRWHISHGLPVRKLGRGPTCRVIADAAALWRWYQQFSQPPREIKWTRKHKVRAIR